jgi:hypothetical protein
MSNRSILGAAVFVALVAQTASGQDNVVENEELRLELIGLKRWTIPMIQDSLRVYAPKDSLLSHACAAVLREKLKFAEASVVYYSTTIDGQQMKPYLAVTVVEPQDSALVRYRGPFRDSLPDRVAWATARAIFEKHNPSFQGAVQRQGFLLGRSRLSAVDSILRPALPLRRFLRDHRAVKNRRLALLTLATDGNWRNRAIAAVLLANFARSDSTWLALVDAMRDPMAEVSATATQVLSTLRREAPRRVDWAPATESLRAILDGTNLFAHNELMEVLAATTIDHQAIDLSWTYNSTAADGLVLYRYGYPYGEFLGSVDLAATETSYRDEGLASSTSYWYFIVAINEDGYSEYSNGAIATTDASPGADETSTATASRPGSARAVPNPRTLAKELAGRAQAALADRPSRRKPMCPSTVPLRHECPRSGR